LKQIEGVGMKPQAYLAGAIQEAHPDDMYEWHDRGTKILAAKGYNVFNPYKHQKVSPKKLAKLRGVDPAFVTRAMRRIVDSDLSQVNKSKILVCKIDKDVLAGAGTIGEITYAASKGIPVYAWVDLRRGAAGLPLWLFGCVTRWTQDQKGLGSIIPESDSLDNYVDSWREEFCDW
jgi:nucleoside 2-deoxyribosyltransferase